jgi:hypothetical protein
MRRPRPSAPIPVAYQSASLLRETPAGESPRERLVARGVLPLTRKARPTVSYGGQLGAGTAVDQAQTSPLSKPSRKISSGRKTYTEP